MKILVFSLIICVFSLAGIDASGTPNAKKYIRYKEYVQGGSRMIPTKKFPHKSNRNSKSKGDLRIIFDESVPDSMRIAINVAKEVWESNLPGRQPIYMTVILTPIEDDVAMMTELTCCSEPELLGCPTSLASQLKDLPIGEPESPDANIYLNSDLNWNCRFTDSEDDGYNVTTMVLRGIAIGLGFGSTLFQISPNEWDYYFLYPSYFDKLLQKDGAMMTSINPQSEGMASFITSENVTIETEHDTYNIYSPAVFKQYKSLVYLNEENSLMSCSLGVGNKFFTVDNATKDILKTMGWLLTDSGFEISCSDISDDGIGSSYTPHTFALSNGSETVTDYSWSFSMKDKSGDYVVVSSGTADTFTIDKIDSPEDYYVNIDGDIEGKVECSYSVRGKTYSAVPFSISLELKPTIVSVENLSIVNNGKYDFSLTFDVHYKGAERVYVELEEEYSPSVRTAVYEEPFYAHVSTGTMNNLYYSWMTIIVKNQYGSTYKTFEYEPKYRRIVEMSGLNDINGMLDGDCGEVKTWIYSLDGNLVWAGSESESEKFELAPGLYIKKVQDSKNGIKVRKISR